ncbi:MAG: hypothetical protein WDN25_16720 [Acetobacteraceae bacterium]
MVEAELVAAGLKSGEASDDVLAVSSGTSSLIYLHPDAERKRERIGTFLAGCPWVGQVIAAADLATIGQAPHYGLGFAVSLRADAETNEFGVPGRSLAARPRWGKPDRLGCGQHGGLGRFEQSPVLLIEGAGFDAGGGARGPGARRRPRAQHHAASRRRGGGDGRPRLAACSAASALSAAATRCTTGPHSPKRFWRKMRSVGYQGLSVRPLSQRQQLS